MAGKDGGVIQDVITIGIKKQIDSSHLTLKRMGVIGAVVVVQAMVKAHSDDEEDLGEPVAESSRNNTVVLEGLLGEALLVECLTNAGMTVKRGEEQNML